VFLLPAGRYLRIDLARSPALMQSVNEHIQTQLCAMHDHAILLGRKTAMERVATMLGAVMHDLAAGSTVPVQLRLWNA
jgi:CRP-like cAMP-binding protein